MTDLQVLVGDATVPRGPGPVVVAHVCNDRGGWGKGFVMALSRRRPEPERDFRAWYRDRAHNDFALGVVRLVAVEPGVHVAIMVGQHGVRTTAAGPPVRHDALERCLRTLGDRALALGVAVQMPRIGCGLAGGTWDRVEPLVRAALCDRGVDVTVLDLPEAVAQAGVGGKYSVSSASAAPTVG